MGWVVAVAVTGGVLAVIAAGGRTPEVAQFLSSGELHRVSPVGAVLIAGSSVAGFGSCLAFASRNVGTGSWRVDFGLRATRLDVAVLSVVGAAAVVALTTGVISGRSGNTSAFDDVSGWTRLAVVALVGVAGPMVEELFFRGLVLAAFAIYGPVLAVAGQAALFALIHLPGADPDARALVLASTFTFGLLTGAVAWVTGRVTVPVGLHAALNLLAVSAV